MSIQLSEQELVRRENLQKLVDKGIDPYPAATYVVTDKTADIVANYKEGSDLYQEVSLAGRFMSRRIMGKASFGEIQDSSGRIQIYVSRDDICEGDDTWMYNDFFKKLLDFGDFIGVKGRAFVTQVGEVSIHVTSITMLSKSLKPLPVVKRDDEGNVYDAFTDPELRYRQRYVDMVVNPEVRKTFEQRTQMYTTMRDYLNERGYLEVETPILQPLYGGANIALSQGSWSDLKRCAMQRRYAIALQSSMTL